MHTWEITFKIFRSRNGKVFNVNICDNLTEQTYVDTWVNKWCMYCESFEVGSLLPLRMELLKLHRLYKKELWQKISKSLSSQRDSSTVTGYFMLILSDLQNTAEEIS